MARCRFITCLAMFASLPLTVIADLAPPPPAKGLKRVPYENTIKLESEIPEYKFYSFKRVGLSGEDEIGEELKLSTKATVTVASGASPSIRTGIVAVPVKVMEELKSKENLAKRLDLDYEGKRPKGVVVFEIFGSSRDIKDGDRRITIENVITISRDKKEGVKFTSKESAAPRNNDAAPAKSSLEPLSIQIATVAFGMAIASLAVWVVRLRAMSRAKTITNPYTAGQLTTESC